MKKVRVIKEKSFNKEVLKDWTYAQFIERYQDQFEPYELEHAARLIGIKDAPLATVTPEKVDGDPATGTGVHPDKKDKKKKEEEAGN